MIRDIGLPDLYPPGSKIFLWVEDAVARIYLNECWQHDPEIFFLTAGGSENVGAVLKDAEERGYGNVFGFRDRDFRASNRADWFDARKGFQCFVPEVHEVENYLLDEAALGGCMLNNNNRNAVNIRRRLNGRAKGLVWWMACRQVIVGLAEEFRAGFLEHPKCPEVTDLTSAEQSIITQEWFGQLKVRANRATKSGEISRRLKEAHSFFQAHLTSGQWKDTFSGKELFREVRGWVYTPPRPASRTDLDVDLAREVARWQVENHRVPLEVLELRQAIRQKAGRS